MERVDWKKRKEHLLVMDFKVKEDEKKKKFFLEHSNGNSFPEEKVGKKRLRLNKDVAFLYLCLVSVNAMFPK